MASHSQTFRGWHQRAPSERRQNTARVPLEHHQGILKIYFLLQLMLPLLTLSPLRHPIARALNSRVTMAPRTRALSLASLLSRPFTRLLAASVFGLMALGNSAQAQSIDGLTLYGIVDTGIGFTSIRANSSTSAGDTGGSRLGMSSGAQSGSRWGLRIRESIDTQTQVIIDLEQGVFSNTGQIAQNGTFFGRQSTLGLDNKTWGRLDFGMQTNLASNYFLAVDPFKLGFGQANMGASFGSADTFRYSNMLLYQTPKDRAWRFGVGYSFNLGVSALYLDSPNPTVLPATNDFSTRNNLRALTLGAKYRNDYVTLVASFDAAYAPANIPATNSSSLTPNQNAPTLKQWILGGSFKTNPRSALTWSAAIGQSFNGAFSGQTPGNNFIGTGLPTDTLGAQILFQPGYNTISYLLGFSWQIDPVQSIFASWQAIQPNMNIETVAPLAFAQTISMAYTYNFSPRTNLYSWVSGSNNFQLFAGNKVFEVGIGLRHLF
jgi:GBP family porin